MYAAEALGAMGKSDGEKILVQLFESDDPNLRVYVVKGISYFSDKTADDLIIQALRDGQYKVRYEAVCAIEKRKSAQAVPYLIFRCKDKSEEKNVKEKCYSVLASMNDSKANEYLVSLIKDKKTGDSTKAKVASVLLQNGSAGTKEILELAESTLKNDAQKNLRYALGKEFAKYSRSEFASICEAYLSSSDVATQGTGLDIWARGKYSGARKIVEEIAADADDENSAENSAKTPTQKKQKKFCRNNYDSFTIRRMNQPNFSALFSPIP
jgi:HEAT repeat protein